MAFPRHPTTGRRDPFGLQILLHQFRELVQRQFAHHFPGLFTGLDDQRLFLSACNLLEVKAHLEKSPKVIIPVGSTEQHGPHSPYGTDSILATEVSVRLARRIDALVGPTLTYGLSGDHRGYPGIPYLSVKTMTGLVQDIVLSLALGGFREIILVNGHYTNSIALSAAFMEIGDRLPKGTIAFPFNYWDALPPDELSAYLGAEVGLHANIGETSAVLAVNESLVKLEHAVREFPTCQSIRGVGRPFRLDGTTWPTVSESDRGGVCPVRPERRGHVPRISGCHTMKEELVAEWAKVLGVSIPGDRLTEVAQSVESQIAGLGGLPSEELEEVEPATLFEPRWDE